MKRPIQRLYPLEVRREEQAADQQDQPAEEREETQRPRRAAALNADYLRRLVNQ